MMTEPLTSRGTYLLTGVALIVLALITTGLAYVDLPDGLNLIVALLIATLMALLILLNFMHLGRGRALPRLAFAAGVFWLAILLVGVLDDYLTRDWFTIPGK